MTYPGDRTTLRALRTLAGAWRLPSVCLAKKEQRRRYCSGVNLGQLMLKKLITSFDIDSELVKMYRLFVISYGHMALMDVGRRSRKSPCPRCGWTKK